MGVTLVVNMIRPCDEAVEADHRTFQIMHMPIPDGKIIKQPDVDVTVRNIITHLNAEPDHKVIVHCKAGRNRAALIAGLVLLRSGEQDPSTVVWFIRSIRPAALANEAFVKHLEDWIPDDSLEPTRY